MGARMAVQKHDRRTHAAASHPQPDAPTDIHRTLIEALEHPHIIPLHRKDPGILLRDITGGTSPAPSTPVLVPSSGGNPLMA